MTYAYEISKWFENLKASPNPKKILYPMLKGKIAKIIKDTAIQNNPVLLNRMLERTAAMSDEDFKLVFS